MNINYNFLLGNIFLILTTIHKIRFVKRIAPRNFVFVPTSTPKPGKFINQRIYFSNCRRYEYQKIKWGHICPSLKSVESYSFKFLSSTHLIKLPGHFLVILSKGKRMSSVSRLFKNGRL